MNWIDDINKKLEEQRAAYKESKESGETFKRKQGYNGIFGANALISKQKEDGTFINRQSTAAKIANAKPERAQKFKELKTSEHQSFAATIANNTLIKCPDGFITSTINYIEYCTKNNLDVNLCEQSSITKQDIIDDLCKNLNQHFSQKEFIEVNTKLNYLLVWSYVKKKNIVKCVKKGIKGSKTNVSLYSF